MRGRPKGSKNKCKHHIYTDEQKQFLKDNYEVHDVSKLTILFNEKYNLKKTKKAIGGSIKRYGFKTNRTGLFTPGQTSYNKGLKQTDYMSEDAIGRSSKTRFKKGNIPVNHRPVGSERISKDGYIEVKVSEPSHWEHKQRIAYEEINGPIPKDSIVTLLDGNKLNLSIDNLKCITKSENLIMNCNGLYSKNPDETETGLLLAKVINKTNKLAKEN